MESLIADVYLYQMKDSEKCAKEKSQKPITIDSLFGKFEWNKDYL